MRVGRLRQRIHTHSFVKALDGGSGIAVDQEAPGKEGIAERSALKDKIALGYVSLVSAWQEEELAALSLVRACIPQVGDVAKPKVIHDAEAVRRAFEHNRAFRQIDPREGINSVGIRGQEERLRVHQGIKNSERAVHSANFSKSPAHGHERSTLHGIEVGLNPALEVEIVVHLLDGRGIGIAALELQGADPGVNLFRSGDAGWNGCLHLVFFPLCERWQWRNHNHQYKNTAHTLDFHKPLLKAETSKSKLGNSSKMGNRCRTRYKGRRAIRSRRTTPKVPQKPF